MSEAIFDPVGALSRNGIIHFPVGTLQEIQDAGLDPAATGCCGNGNGNTIRGCPVAKHCPFIRNGVGNYRGKLSTKFKGKGPEMVGVAIRTARSSGYRAMETEVTCYNFTAVLLARMRAGRAAEERGEDFERIEIVALSGENIAVKEIIPVNPEMYRLGKDLREKVKVTLKPVSKYPRPSDNTGVGYEGLMRQREKEREEQRELQFLPREEQLKKILEDSEKWAEHDVSPAIKEQARIQPTDENEPSDETSETEAALLSGEVAGDETAATPGVLKASA